MANFCRFCGSPVKEGQRFCQNCGKSLLENAQQPEEKRMQGKYSMPKSSEPTYSVPGTKSKPSPTPPKQPPVQRPPQAQPARHVVRPEASPQSKPVNRGQGTTAVHAAVARLQNTAASAAGEIDLGEFGLSAVGEGVKPLSSVLSPVSGIFHGIGQYAGGIFRIFKKPSALIGTVLIGALWYVLAGLRGSDSAIVKALSWLTYAEGGFDRSIPGMVGGILGRGTVAASLISLFSGGGKNLIKGVGALFAGHGEKRGVVSILLGILIGCAVYAGFAGLENLSAGAAMPGIAGAVLSLEALGGGRGKLYELAQSLTSKASGGIRTAVRGKCDGLLTGLAIGFALAAALAAFI